MWTAVQGLNGVRSYPLHVPGAVGTGVWPSMTWTSVSAVSSEVAKMLRQVIAGHEACESTLPRCAAQVVVSPAPMSCSQKVMFASAASVFAATILFFGPPTTYPSAHCSRTTVAWGGLPKWTAIGLLNLLRSAAFPAASSCGIGDSICAHAQPHCPQT